MLQEFFLLLIIICGASEFQNPQFIKYNKYIDEKANLYKEAYKFCIIVILKIVKNLDITWRCISQPESMLSLSLQKAVFFSHFKQLRSENRVFI